jgi:hypothetical protein
MDQKVKQFNGFSLWQVSKDNLPAFSSFVAEIYSGYCNKQNIVKEEEIQNILKYDMQHYDWAYFYAIRNTGNTIIATIKVTRWQSSLYFPIHGEFNVDIKRILENLPFKHEEIWHLGRLAIDQRTIATDKQLSKYRLTMLKILLIAAFRHICTNDNNIMIAECDTRLNEKIRLLGINSITVGSSMMYLGSETVPIYNTGRNLRKFLSTYGHVWNV